eukprot:544658_1
MRAMDEKHAEDVSDNKEIARLQEKMFIIHKDMVNMKNIYVQQIEILSMQYKEETKKINEMKEKYNNLKNEMHQNEQKSQKMLTEIQMLQNDNKNLQNQLELITNKSDKDILSIKILYIQQIELLSTQNAEKMKETNEIKYKYHNLKIELEKSQIMLTEMKLLRNQNTDLKNQLELMANKTSRSYGDEPMYDMRDNKNPKAIHSNLLVFGYIRMDIEKMYQLTIPKGIKNILYEYWLIKLCKYIIVNRKSGNTLDHYFERSIEAFNYQPKHINHHWIFSRAQSNMSNKEQKCWIITNCKSKKNLEYVSGNLIRAINTDTSPKHQWILAEHDNGYYAITNKSSRNTLDHYFERSIKARNSNPCHVNHQWKIQTPEGKLFGHH